MIVVNTGQPMSKSEAQEAALRRMQEDLSRYAKELARQFKAQYGRQPWYDKRAFRDFYRLPAFEGSYKVPEELLRAYLSHRDDVDHLAVSDRHEHLLPIALHAIGADNETVDKQVWYKPLNPEFQLGAMHKLLREHGYAPASTDNTLTKMRALVLAGKPDVVTDSRVLSYGEGSHKVVIGPDRLITYRGDSRTAQVMGSRYRVKIGGKLVSLWTWLEPSVSKLEQARIRELIAEADYRAGAQRYKARKKAADEMALEDTGLFDTFELPT